jgi:hypothetical protein
VNESKRPGAWRQGSEFQPPLQRVRLEDHFERKKGEGLTAVGTSHRTDERFSEMFKEPRTVCTVRYV